MAEPEGIPTFWDAVAAAQAELDQADSSESVDETSAVTSDKNSAPADQASQEGTDQPSEEAEASIFGDLVVEEVPVPVDPLALEVDVDGSPVKVSDLRDGYLRQADYTRKTQTLAEERKRFETEQAVAADLMSRLRDDPAGTIAALAVEVGLIDPSTVRADLIANVNAARAVPKREDVEADIERRIAEAVDNDPRVQAAMEREMLASIESDFSALEDQYGVKLNGGDRTLVMQRAVDLNTPNLNLAFLSLRDEAERRRTQSGSLKSTATSRPQTGDGDASVDTPQDTKGLSIDELFALVEQGKIK